MWSGLSLSAMVSSVRLVHKLSALTSMYSSVSGRVRLVMLGKLSAPLPVMNSRFMGISTRVTRSLFKLFQNSWSASIPMILIHKVEFSSSSHTL